LISRFSYGTWTWSPRALAWAMGTKVDLVPNRPVFTSAHSGWPDWSST
jgi:hypothetical protein